MEQAILALLGVVITLMLYLDRGRRADLALHREETQRRLTQMQEGTDKRLTQMEERTDKRLTQMEERTDKRLTQMQEEMQRGLARLTDMIMDLVSRVSRLESRGEAASTPSRPSR